MYSETNELLKQIITKLGNIEGTVCRRGEPWPCGHGAGRTGGTDKQACRHRTERVGKKGRQTEYMEKQRKVFLDYLKIHHETASKTRMTLARDCWAIHRKEWNAAAKKGIGYSDYKALSRAKLM